MIEHKDGVVNITGNPGITLAEAMEWLGAVAVERDRYKEALIEITSFDDAIPMGGIALDEGNALPAALGAIAIAREALDNE